jgi:hypothetical protein
MKRKFDPIDSEPAKRMMSADRLLRDLRYVFWNIETQFSANLSMKFFNHAAIGVLPTLTQYALTMSYLSNAMPPPGNDSPITLLPEEYLAKLLNREFNILRP